MKINNVKILNFSDVIDYGSRFKDKHIHLNNELSIEDRLKKITQLSKQQKLDLMKHIKVNFEINCTLYFINKLAGYNIDTSFNVFESMVKAKKFKHIENTNPDYVFEFTFNQWKSLLGILNQLKNRKDRVYSSLLGKEVNYEEMLNHVLLNMPMGLNWGIVFSTNYFDLLQFKLSNVKSFIFEDQIFIDQLDKLTLFNELSN